MSNLRIKIFTIILVSSYLLFAGCAKEDTKVPVEITLMHGWGGSLQTHKTMQAIYDEFQVQNPDIILTSIPSADSSITVKNANDMLAVGKMPDIVSTNGLSYYVKNCVSRGKALDLMPYILADDGLCSEIHPLVLKTWSNDDNTIYTVPDALEVMGFWYNKSFLVEAGFVGNDGEARVPATWDEFFELCSMLKAWQDKEKNGVRVCALENVQIVENIFLARLAGDSEEGLQMASGVPMNFDRPPMKNTVQDIGKLLSYSENTDTINNARQLFLEGKTAMYFNGIWESELFLDSAYADDISYACYPTNYNASLAYISPSSGYVIRDSEDPRKVDACIRFLKYILSKEVQEKIALETGQAPENPNIDYSLITATYPLFGQGLETISSADIQIKSISSVWDSRIIDQLSSSLAYTAENMDSYTLLIEELNALA